MRYLPHTDEEIAAMCAVIGTPNVDALFDSIPDPVRRTTPLDVEPALDEVSLMGHLKDLAHRNGADSNGVNSNRSFLGYGFYDHHIPPAVDQLLLRSEFYTAYTPYQPEVAQGTLQAIFEFQTVVSELLGLPVANASMYDGASGLAEALLMARRIQKLKRPRILLSEGLHPHYRDVAKTYLSRQSNCQIEWIPLNSEGTTDLGALQKALGPDVSSVALGYPNYLGSVEPLEAVCQACNAHDVMVISATSEPYALALLKSPGACGVDIAVGEGQALAISPSFGGPGVGLFAAKTEYLRQLPGRLVGATQDTRGNTGYVLTLSTREQHIRRERATSNICTNHGLIALSMVIRTTMLGKTGFQKTAQLCLNKAQYLKTNIAELEGFQVPFGAPTFNEFAVTCDRPLDTLTRATREQGFQAGFPTKSPDGKDLLLLAVTEKHTRQDLDDLTRALAAARDTTT